MKIRNFKKALRRVGCYRYREPRILSKIFVYDNTEHIYYTCCKLEVVANMSTGEFESIKITKRRKR